MVEDSTAAVYVDTAAGGGGQRAGGGRDRANGQADGRGHRRVAGGCSVGSGRCLLMMQLQSLN
jgi:hypothetical protein